MLVKIVQSIIFGLPQGLLYGLMGLGLSVIYSTTGAMNFAQGNLGMFGVFAGWTMLALTKSLPLGIIVGILTGMASGFLVNKYLMRRVHTHAAMLIITLGILLVLDGVVLIIWGTEPLLFPDIFTIPPIIFILPELINKNNMPLIIPGNDMMTGISALVLAASVIMFFRYTKIGKAAQARAQDEIGARAVGISIKKIDTISWSTGIAVAVITGFLIAPKTTVTSTMLANLQLYGFTAAVFGGFSSPGGALVGGVILGILEKIVVLGFDEIFSSFELPVNAVDFQLSIILVVIIITLTIKPTGLISAKFKGKV